MARAPEADSATRSGLSLGPAGARWQFNLLPGAVDRRRASDPAATRQGSAGQPARPLPPPPFGGNLSARVVECADPRPEPVMSNLLRVQLTPDELLERARRIAECWHQVAALDEQIKAEREHTTAERKSLLREIGRLADAIRTGAEDRTAQVGLWPDERK